ncbi:hypothetical protein F5148DRAFT_41461 [Russula earlei]|uniref:Uncharacterized protein n=1 Tax=Russula earlei TaxID=71964 RepID=A0ACC0U8G1_9AGAM|nr:hypothetical protein F5148DRAFT_41461 [Russula earlei]
MCRTRRTCHGVGWRLLLGSTAVKKVIVLSRSCRVVSCRGRFPGERISFESPSLAGDQCFARYRSLGPRFQPQPPPNGSLDGLALRCAVQRGEIALCGANVVWSRREEGGASCHIHAHAAGNSHCTSNLMRRACFIFGMNVSTCKNRHEWQWQHTTHRCPIFFFPCHRGPWQDRDKTDCRRLGSPPGARGDDRYSTSGLLPSLLRLPVPFSCFFSIAPSLPFHAFLPPSPSPACPLPPNPLCPCT